MRNGKGGGNGIGDVAVAEPDPKLTPHQVAILQWISKGKHTDEIALLMNTSTAAVNNQLTRIMDLTGAATRASAMAWAMRRGLIT